MTERGWHGPHRTFLEEAEGLPCIWPLLCPQWNLVCSHRAFRQLAQSLYMVGVLLGAMMFGYLADRSVLGKPRSWVKLGLGDALTGFKAGVADWVLRRLRPRKLLLSSVAQPGSWQSSDP